MSLLTFELPELWQWLGMSLDTAEYRIERRRFVVTGRRFTGVRVALAAILLGCSYAFAHAILEEPGRGALDRITALLPAGAGLVLALLLLTVVQRTTYNRRQALATASFRVLGARFRRSEEMHWYQEVCIADEWVNGERPGWFFTVAITGSMLGTFASQEYSTALQFGQALASFLSLPLSDETTHEGRCGVRP